MKISQGSSKDKAILIDDSEEEGEKCFPETIKEMKDLSSLLKENYKVMFGDDKELEKWRMKLNPFREYGFLYGSEYATEDIEYIFLPSDPSDMNISKNSNEFSMIDNVKNEFKEISPRKNNCGEGLKGNHAEENRQIHGCECREEKEMNKSSDIILNLGQNNSGSPEKFLKDSLLDKCADYHRINLNLESNYSTPQNLKASPLTEQAEGVPSQSNEVNSDNEKTTTKKIVPKLTDEVEKDEHEFRSPYYLQNFMHIMKTVMESDECKLFNSIEVKVMQNFKEMSDPAKKLYIRLFQRKRDWFRCDKIKYPNIGSNLSVVFKELVACDLLYNETALVEFNDICNLLSAPEMKSLAVDIKLKAASGKNTKGELMKLLKKHCQKQRTIFMAKDTMKSILSKSAKKYIGACIKLKEDKGFVFTRAILLFCLTTSHFEEAGHSYGTSLLYHMLQVNIGDVKYPFFNIVKQIDIFPTRLHLIDYAQAVELENSFDIAVEKKDFKTAMEYYQKVIPELMSILQSFIGKSVEKKIYCLSLRGYLACFSKEWVIIRLAGKCVDVLEKERNYTEAVSLIELLLSQPFLCLSSRGFLWERLIIDSERYLKDHDKTFLSTVEALKDPYLRSGHRYTILQRHKRLESSPKVTDKAKKIDVDIDKEEISEPKEQTIRTKIFIESSLNNRAVFLSPGIGDGYKLSNVEQHVITYYQENGFPCGKHGEGSSVTTLFFLLFWDSVFMDIPDVFRCKFQNSPLDIFRDDFYSNRKDNLNKRLNFIYHASEQELRTSIESSWKVNYGTYCLCVNWNLFENETEAADLAVCIGSKILGGICELFCKDLRRRKGGFPDLIVWNVEKKVCKIIEVKGPGDKLSFKQIVWLDVLSFLGADAFVCHVTGVGGKRKHDLIE